MRKVLFAVVFLFLVSSVQPAFGTSLLVNQVGPYAGYGYGLFDWEVMTADLNTAFGGAGNITVDASPLNNLAFMLTFDRLWITARQPGDPGLSAAEQANVAAYIATGRRVAMIGENSAWNAWNQSILAPVGGTYGGATTSSVLTPAIVHELTAGVSSLFTIADGVVASGGTSVFDQNVVTLWGGAQNALSILSVNIQDDDYGANLDNPTFRTNVATWLAGSGQNVPEPSSVVLLAAGLLALASRFARRS
jgi:hypothetical protein